MGFNLKVTGWKGVDWICLAYDGPSDGCCEYDNEPSGSVMS